MSTKVCVLCGKPVEDCIVAEIQPTICCKECCENVEDDEDKKFCSEFRAKLEFGCRACDLKKLDHGTAIKFSFRRQKFFQTFLIAEAKHLGEIATSLKEQRANLKRPSEEEKCITKRQRLETKHRAMVREIRPILRPFVLGDYLKSSRSKTLLRDVKQRYSVKDRASELVSSCNAHPISALAFCMGHPRGTAETYKELRENMRKVFLIEGNRIMQKLTPGDRERLKGTPLEDALIQFQNRDSKTILFKKLEEKVGTTTAEEIISHPACQQRISRGGEETQVAEKLVAFWKSKDDKEQRHLELDDVLDERNVRLPVVPGIFYKYIEGEIDVDLEEVVGITEIYSDLFFLDHTHSANYDDVCIAEFQRCLIEEQMTLDESLEMAMKKFPTKREKPFVPFWLLFNAVMNQQNK